MCYAYETLQFTVIIVRAETGRNNLYFRKTLLLNVDPALMVFGVVFAIPEFLRRFE